MIKTVRIGIRVFTSLTRIESGPEYSSYNIEVYDEEGENREENELYIDFKSFFNFVREYFKEINPGPFSFQFSHELVNQFIIDQALKNVDTSEWDISQDDINKLTILKLK